MDTSNTWLVSKLGNDANTGHASTYPINLANDAKLTIGAAAALAAAGDTILIWPGTYSELLDLATTGLNKALSIVGINRHKTIITYPSGYASTVRLGSFCTLKNITVTCVDPNKAVDSGSGITNILIEDCNIVGIIEGLDLYGASNVFIFNCYVEGTYDGFYFGLVKNLIAEKCIFKTTGAYVGAGEHRAGQCGPGDYIFRDCIFLTGIDARASGQIGGLVGREGTATTMTLISCINCSFEAQNSTNQTAFGIKANNYCQIALCNCNAWSKSTTGAAYHLYIVTGGKIVVTGCAYDPTKCYGKPINLDSRWVQAIRETVPVGAGL